MNNIPQNDFSLQPLDKITSSICRLFKTRENRLLEVLTKSKRFDDFKKNNKSTRGGVKERKKVLEVFINYCNINYSFEKGVNLPNSFDLIYEIVTGDFKLYKRYFNRNSHKFYIEKDKTDLLNFVLQLQNHEGISELIEGEDYYVFNGLDRNLFIKGAIKAKENKNKVERIKLSREGKIQREYIKDKQAEGHLVDDDEQKDRALPSHFYNIDEEQMNDILKKIRQVSMVTGKYTTDLITKGSKIKGVIPTSNIEDVKDFIGSSIAYAKKDKKLFIKQLLEKQVFKLEKPSEIQDEKRYIFSIFLDNSLDSQKVYIADKRHSVKSRYLIKTLSSLLISDLAYIFSDIKHWNLDVGYHFLPYREERPEDAHTFEVEEITKKTKKFINFNNYLGMYNILKNGCHHFSMNTINYNEYFLPGKILDRLDDAKKEDVNLRKKRSIRTKIFIFFITSKTQEEKNKKIEEIRRCLNGGKKAYIANFDFSKKEEIELLKIGNGIDREREEIAIFDLKNGFKKIRVIFLKDLIKEFGGKNAKQ